MIEKLVPGISPELALVYQEFPWEDKIKLNGMLPEQRLLVVTELHRSLAVSNQDEFQFIANNVYQEAINLLFPFAERLFKESRPDIVEVLPLAKDNDQLRKKFIQLCMEYSADWEKVINGLAGETFDFCQNKFRVIRYHQGEGKRKRSRALAVCEAIDYLDPYHEKFCNLISKYKLGEKIGISTIQLEIVLERGLV